MNDAEADRATALIERIGRLVSRDAHADGLQPVQWEALRYLDKANRFSRTAAAVTAYLGLTKGTVSQTLKALEAKGLIRKHVDPKDRRSNKLMLTARGRRALDNDPLIDTAAAVARLPERTRHTLTQGLGELLQAMLVAQDRQPFGQCQDCMYFARQHPQGRPHLCQLLNERLADADAMAICVEQQPAV